MGYLRALSMCLISIAVAWKDDSAEGSAFPPNAVLSSPACAVNCVCFSISPGDLRHTNRFWIILSLFVTAC